jgi:DNA-binding transcriptional LysR family regulator
MSSLTSELIGALADASSDLKATLVVSAVESVGAYVLPSRLATLRGRWPGVRVEVLTGSCEEIRDRVARGESDVGLVLEPETGPEVGAVLAKARLLILGAPTPRLRAPGATPDQLGDCDFYMCDAAGNYHQALQAVSSTGAQIPAPRIQAIGTIEGVEARDPGRRHGARPVAGARRRTGGCVTGCSAEVRGAPRAALGRAA